MELSHKVGPVDIIEMTPAFTGDACKVSLDKQVKDLLALLRKRVEAADFFLVNLLVYVEIGLEFNEG